MLELILLGVTVGLLSGFFGIGGGTVLVPVLLILGYDMKAAVTISVVQMVFSSVYGSYINSKKGTLDAPMIIIIGLGGFCGGLLSGLVTSNVDNIILEFTFLLFAFFALLRMFFKTKEHQEQREVNRFLLFFIGFILGVISMSIGVGGSLILVPILAGFLYVPLKKAISAGLFFVVFSSLSGVISHSMSEYIDYTSGITIGLASLFGVYIGIVLKDKVDVGLQRKLLIGFYFLVVTYLVKRIFF